MWAASIWADVTRGLTNAFSIRDSRHCKMVCDEVIRRRQREARTESAPALAGMLV